MFISALIYRPANKDLYPHLLPWTVSYIMCSYRDWQPLTLPDSFSLHASWLLIRGRVSTTQTRGETLLRWQCGQGIWHEQMLPVTRRGTLLELVYLPTELVICLCWQVLRALSVMLRLLSFVVYHAPRVSGVDCAGFCLLPTLN